MWSNSIRDTINGGKVMLKNRFKVKVVLFLFCIFFSSFQLASKIDAEVVNSVIDDIYITHEDNTTTNPWSLSETVRVNVEYSIPNNTVSEGDISQFYLPEILLLMKSENFTMEDEDGIVVANVYADKDTGLVTITYTDYVENHSNIHGSMWFYSKFDRTVITDGGEKTLIFEDTNGFFYEQNIELSGPSESMNELIFKSGEYADNSNGTRLQWYARVNVKEATIPNATFVDTPDTTYQQIIPSSLVIFRVNYTLVNGQFVISNHVNVTSQFTKDINTSKIEINFGNITGESYLVGYQTEILNQPPIGTFLQNTVQLFGSDGTNKTYEQNVLYSSGGGNGTGETGSLTIHKLDGENNSNLQGATFDLLSTTTGIKVGTYTSNSDGKIEINNLLYDDYELIETQAPSGYLTDATPIPIKINSTVPIERTVKNYKLKLGSVILEKRDDVTGKALSGAKFKLLDNQGKVLLENLQTNLDGKIFVDQLEAGNYSFVETQAPEGYQVNDKPILFQIKYNEDSTIFLVFTNALKPVTFIEKPSIAPKKERIEIRTWIETDDTSQKTAYILLLMFSGMILLSTFKNKTY